MPTEEKWFLNGKAKKTFWDLYFLNDLDYLPVAFYYSGKSYRTTFENTIHRKVKNEKDNLLSEEVIYIKFLNKLITCDSIHNEIIEYLYKQEWGEERKEYWQYLLRPFIKEVDQVTNLSYNNNVGKTIYSIFKEFIKIVSETEKSFFEFAYDREIDLLFPM